MTLYLDSANVRELCTPEIALAAARAAVDAQRSGDFVLPPRIDTTTSHGFFRVMPAAVAGYAGAKIMTVAKGAGNRYLLLLYSQASGDLVAILDADEVTRLRTAAITAVAADLLVPDGVSELGLIGTGFEATGHLEAFHRLWNLKTVRVYSRSAEKREAFAARMSPQLGITVLPVATSAEVTGVSPVTLLCTKATSPVLDGAEIAHGATILSIGSTRPDLRELDVTTLSRAAVVLVDDAHQVEAESGDIQAGIAAGVITPEHLVPLSQWPAWQGELTADRDLKVFKSVGTALQDITLAAQLVAAATAAGCGRELGELAGLKAAG